MANSMIDEAERLTKSGARSAEPVIAALQDVIGQYSRMGKFNTAAYSKLINTLLQDVGGRPLQPTTPEERLSRLNALLQELSGGAQKTGSGEVSAK